jgi:hypothetical protein
MKMTFQEIWIIATGPCIANQLRDVNTICRRSWYIAAHVIWLNAEYVWLLVDWYVLSICCCARCLTPTQQFFNYIMARTSYFSMRWWWGPLCTRPTCLLVGFYSASSLKQQFADRHVPPLWHYPDSEKISLCSFSLMLHK